MGRPTSNCGGPVPLKSLPVNLCRTLPRAGRFCVLCPSCSGHPPFGYHASYRLCERIRSLAPVFLPPSLLSCLSLSCLFRIRIHQTTLSTTMVLIVVIDFQFYRCKMQMVLTRYFNRLSSSVLSRP